MADKGGKPRGGRPKGGGGDELVFVALGGLGEIGMNVYLYGFGPEDARQWLMVDLGITFPGDGEPGADVVLPDLRFISEQRQNLVGIVLTHAHEDHVGAVIDLWGELRAPIYATPFTAGMVRSKSSEFGGKIELPLNVVDLGARFKVGPFDLELVTMAHSIPEPSAVAIRTPLGTVLHTGDWKLDHAPLVGDPPNEERIKAIGDEGVLALVCDSTNAFRDGRSPSETEIARSISEIVKSASRRVVVTSFSSNVARVMAVADAARATGRELVVAGRALHRVIDVAVDTGYLPQGFRYHDQQRFSDFDAREVLLLCTGSQGEARAALARISEQQHPDIALAKGDLVVFSSRTIPGNERSVGAIQNNLARLGVDVLTAGEALVHVTGHPRREELRQMYAWTRPRIAIPMHGEARHLKEQARLAREAGVAEVFPVLNGEIVRIAPEAKVIDDAPVGRRYRDGKLIVPGEDGPVRERRKLAFVGVAVVSLVITRKGELVGDPEAELDGVPLETAAGEPILDAVLDAVDGTLRSIPPARRKDPAMLEEAIRRSVRSAINEVWGKKPICKVFVHVLDGR